MVTTSVAYDIFTTLSDIQSKITRQSMKTGTADEKSREEINRSSFTHLPHVYMVQLQDTLL